MTIEQTRSRIMVEASQARTQLAESYIIDDILKSFADSVKEEAAKVALEYGRAKYNNSIEVFAAEQIVKLIRQMEIK